MAVLDFLKRLVGDSQFAQKWPSYPSWVGDQEQISYQQLSSILLDNTVQELAILKDAGDKSNEKIYQALIHSVILQFSIMAHGGAGRDEALASLESVFYRARQALVLAKHRDEAQRLEEYWKNNKKGMFQAFLKEFAVIPNTLVQVASKDSWYGYYQARKTQKSLREHPCENYLKEAPLLGDYARDYAPLFVSIEPPKRLSTRGAPSPFHYVGAKLGAAWNSLWRGEKKVKSIARLAVTVASGAAIGYVGISLGIALGAMIPVPVLGSIIGALVGIALGFLFAYLGSGLTIFASKQFARLGSWLHHGITNAERWLPSREQEANLKGCGFDITSVHKGLVALSKQVKKTQDVEFNKLERSDRKAKLLHIRKELLEGRVRAISIDKRQYQFFPEQYIPRCQAATATSVNLVQ